MAHMLCECGEGLSDCDGTIVYDVYRAQGFRDYAKTHEKGCTFSEMYFEYTSATEDSWYFWLCDKCKAVYLWDHDPKHTAYRKFEPCALPDQLDLDKVKSLDEYFIININDDCDDLLLSDLFEKNPFRPYKYFTEKDLSRVYIIDTNRNAVDRVYKLVRNNTGNKK